MSDVIARVKMASVKADSAPVNYGRSRYYGYFEFQFKVEEYLKGTGSSEIKVLTPLYLGAVGQSKEQMLQEATRYLSRRDTTWDKLEGIVFLRQPPELSVQGRASSAASGIRMLEFTGSLPNSVDIHKYAITNDHNRAWLPSANAATGSSGSGEKRYYTQAPQQNAGSTGSASSSASTITLSELKKRIKANADLLAENSGVAGYADCVKDRYRFDAFIRQGNYDRTPSASAISFPSGQAAGYKVHSVPDDGLHYYSNWWLTGQDSDIFVYRLREDPDKDPSTGFVWDFVATRPVPEGVYQVFYHNQPSVWVPCNYNPVKLQNRKGVFLNVTAPTSIIQEAFFDPVAIGAGFGADASNGVLKTAPFKRVGSSAMMISAIGWEAQKVKVRLSPHATLADRHIDFLALDASIALRLDFDDATVTAEAGGSKALAWRVCKQPWTAGDLLMLRISESPDELVGVTNDISCLSLTPIATTTPMPAATPTPTGPAVTVGDALFAAEIADTPELRSKGLGQRDSLPEKTGMLFVFPSGQASSFWMFGMRFPLDFVWIGEDCTVVDLTENVQHYPPDTPSSELDIFESAYPAAYTFEINAGEVGKFGIERGDSVQFHSIESEFAKCCESGVCDSE